MSTRIEHITFGSENDGRIVLSNSAIARKLSVGNGWTRIRICARICLEDTGGNIVGAPTSWVGVLSDPNGLNGPLTSNTSHFVGVKTAGGTMTRYSGYYGLSGSDGVAVKKVKGTTTVSSSTAYISGVRDVSNRVSTARSLCVVEIKKGSTSFTCQSVSPTNTNAMTQDYSMLNVKTLMNIDTMSGVSDYLSGVSSTWTTSSALSVAVSESNDGPLNGICIAWNRADAPMHISDVMVSYFE